MPRVPPPHVPIVAVVAYVGTWPLEFKFTLPSPPAPACPCLPPPVMPSATTPPRHRERDFSALADDDGTRYHLGSVALGSFLIAVIQLVRAILAYLDKKSKSMQDKNLAIKFAFKCIGCCLWCFEKCVKYLSKNAYVRGGVE